MGFLYSTLPHISNQNFPFPTIVGKFIPFLSCCLFFLSIVTLRVFVKRIEAFRISLIDITLFLLLVYVFVNRNYFHSVSSFSIRYIELLGLILIYLVFRNIGKNNHYYLLLIVVLSGTIQAVYGNLQLLNYFPSNHSVFKITGSYFNPGPYAGFLASVWPLALGTYLYRSQILFKLVLFNPNTSKFVKSSVTIMFEYIPLLCLVSIIIVLPSTQSRAAWLAVIVSSSLLIEYRYAYASEFCKAIKNRFKRFIAFLIICIFGASIYGIYHFKKASADGRLLVWRVSKDIIKDNPLFGVGFDRFKAYYMDYQANYFNEYNTSNEVSSVADNTYYAFNEWLQFVVEEGVIGLLLLLVLLWILYKIIRGNQYENKYIVIITASSLLSIGVFAFFSYPLQILPIKLIIVLLLALLAAFDQNKLKIQIVSLTQCHVIKSVKLIFITLSAIVLVKSYSYCKDLNVGYKTWKDALTLYQYGDYEGSVDKYAYAYEVFKKDGDFLMNYGKALTMANKNEKAIEILEKSKKFLNTTIIETALGDAYKTTEQYIKAESAYQKAFNMIPIRFYPLYLLAKLYEETGEYNKTISIAESIINKEIKVPSTAIKEIKAEMKIMIDKYKNKE